MRSYLDQANVLRVEYERNLKLRFDIKCQAAFIPFKSTSMHVINNTKSSSHSRQISNSLFSAALETSNTSKMSLGRPRGRIIILRARWVDMIKYLMKIVLNNASRASLPITLHGKRVRSSTIRDRTAMVLHF